MGMAQKMKEKAIPATSAKRSAKVVKSITRADIAALNYSMAPIIEQNRIEMRASDEAIAKDSNTYGSSNIIVKKLTKKY